MSQEPEEAVQEVPREPEKKPRAPQRIFTRQQKLKYLLIDFLGWWIINYAVWALLGRGYGVIGLITFPTNIIVLIIMAFANRWVALGIAAAIALNLVISLFLGLFVNVFCWIPFTSPTPLF